MKEEGGASRLTPTARAFAASVAQRPRLQDLPVKAGRQGVDAGMRSSGGPYLPLRRIEDIPIPTATAGAGAGEAATTNSSSSSSSLPVRLYLPTLSPPSPLPVLLFIHGGGWVVGSVAGYDACCRRLASLGNVVVVSVEYRLSPEVRYPAALDDVEAAYTWALTTLANTLYPQVVDPEQAVVCGDSAGGNLSAALVIRLRRKGHLPPRLRPKAQVLVYPCLDFTLSSASHRTFADGPLLTKPLIDWFMAHYLGGDSSSQALVLQDPELSPLLLPDPAPLVFPPTLLVVAEVDPLADDSHRLYHRLTTEEGGQGSSAVVHQLVVYRGVPHGFFTHHEVFPEARDAMARVTTYLAHRAWQQPPQPHTSTPAAAATGRSSL